MKKNNSKKWIKTITITTAILVFAAGAVFALKSAGTANTDKDSADTVVAAANEATDLVVKETVSEKETEVITETAATEATTEEATEAVTEQSSTIAEIQPQTEVATEAVQEPEVTEAVTELPVVQTPSDERVAQVISGINAERAAAAADAAPEPRPLPEPDSSDPRELHCRCPHCCGEEHPRPDGPAADRSEREPRSH